MPQAKTENITQARTAIDTILGKYKVTLPQVIGITPRKQFEDEEKLFESYREDYERIQEEMFKEHYPNLYARAKKEKHEDLS